MIDTSKTIQQFINEGFAIAVFEPVTLLTDDQTPLHIGGVDVHVLHKSLPKPDHDTKAWKMAVGKDTIAQARTQSEKMLSDAVNTAVLKSLMAQHTTI